MSEGLSEADQVRLVQQISTMALNAELNGTETDFCNFLLEFFTQQAQKHYLRGYTQALIEMGQSDG